MLEEADRRRLLLLARNSIRSHLERGEFPLLEPAEGPLEEPKAVFVSLHRGGKLRGCVGLVEKTTPLWMGVRDMAVAAATKDSRFEPFELAELGETSIEISVLTDFQRIDDPTEITIGAHGLYLKKDSRSGLLLPQVATEHHWGAIQFLERTSRKAGFPAKEWKEGAELFIFSCEIFDDVSCGL